MQCPSTVRSYVFRSIFLPYLSTSTSVPASSPSPSIRQCQYTTTTAAAVKLTSKLIRSDPSPPIFRYRTQPLDTTNPRRPISSLQQVRGHDPPNIDKQTISQRRTREYLGFRDERGKSEEHLSGHTRTNVRALEKILQSYRSGGREDNEQGCINRKGKQKEQEQEDQAGIVFGTSKTASVTQTQIQQPTHTQHTPSTIPSIDIPSSSNRTQACPTSTQKSTSYSLSSATSTLHSDLTPTFPPILQRLLSARLFRLAVFHALSTPEYATNTPLLLGIADHLELTGAGKLARRLRRGWENSRESSQSSSASANADEGKKKIRLFSDPRPRSIDHPKDRLPSNYWQIPLISPSQLNPNLTKQHSLTEYYNAHLEFHLKKSSLSLPQFPSSSSPGMNDWPHPSGNLNQLRKLLSSIEKLERHRGFIPDRKTGNLIIGCWLRSVTTHPHPHSRGEDELREYKDREGNIRVARKQYSEKGRLGVKELRGLFGVLSRIIVSTRAMTVGGEVEIPSDGRSLKFEEGVDDLQMKVDDTAISLTGTGPGTSKRLDDHNQKEYEEIVRPFGKNMIRSMKNLGDGKGVDMVREWMREQKEALMKDGD